MNHLNRVWMAASVAVVQQSHSDQGHKWKSGVKCVQHGKRRLFGADSSDLRPISGVIGSDLTGVIGNCESQADESIRQVMFLSCWGQS
ncbi:hypothetical protein SLE2022_050780 [Rubroshorea leprosula]|uniref:Secreted protein n=1 Tax=Rubroshorea leprosula TaxID=152421 RepID=A0AAV5IBY9_9ROSI|nr:hypothetical protein SLEP1_g9791 [Rubroshorea leprosula]